MQCIKILFKQLMTPQVGDLSSCPSLIRLDLSQNSIEDTSFVTTCQQIKWLSLANNPVADLRPLQCLTELQVASLVDPVCRACSCGRLGNAKRP